MGVNPRAKDKKLWDNNNWISRNSDGDPVKVLSDNREEKQPWLHSYEEMVQELTEQGFSEDEIEELYQNEKEIFEQCRYFNNTTIFPKQMFIPDFPGLNVKEELPKLAFKKLKEMDPQLSGCRPVRWWRPYRYGVPVPHLWGS